VSPLSVCLLSLPLLWPAYLLGSWLLNAARVMRRSHGDVVLHRAEWWPMVEPALLAPHAHPTPEEIMHDFLELGMRAPVVGGRAVGRSTRAHRGEGTR
jgi:hypothetical protein